MFDPVHVSVFLMLLSGGLGFYIGRRGLSGIQSDVTLVKTDLNMLKGKVLGSNDSTQVTVQADATHKG